MIERDPRRNNPHEDTPDLSELQADDALLNALGGADPAVATSLDDQELNALLVSWRRDIDSEPFAELVDVPTAVRTVRTAELARKAGPKGRKRRVLIPVAAAAAVLTIAFTGTSLAARDAQPGDALWGMSKVLYSEHAQSIEAATAARLDLENAKLALAQGNLEEARRALAAAQDSMRRVAPEDDLSALMSQHRELVAMLNDSGPQTPGTSQNGSMPPPGSPVGPTTVSPTGGNSQTVPSTSNPTDTVLPPPTQPPTTTTTTTTPTPSSLPNTGSSPRGASSSGSTG